MEVVETIQRVKSYIPEGGFLWHVWVFPGRFKRYGFKLWRPCDYHRIKRLLAKKLRDKVVKRDHVTIVVTSAGRREYLEKTIESLRRNFQYNPKKTSWFIIDDFPASEETRRYLQDLRGFDLKILNEENKGLGYSLNRIYAEVTSEYVFYCQDDWEFLRIVPAEEMIGILQENPHLRQILLAREPIKKEEYVGFSEVRKGFAECYGRWFSFNPHLAKTELFLKTYPFPLSFTEDEYTFKLNRRGYRVSGVLGYHEEPYVRHLGLRETPTLVK